MNEAELYYTILKISYIIPTFEGKCSAIEFMTGTRQNQVNATVKLCIWLSDMTDTKTVGSGRTKKGILRLSFLQTIVC